MDNLLAYKKRMLVFEAMRWIGFTEKGGDNKGQIIEMFQKAVDGKAQGEPWCLAMVQFCVMMVDRQYDYVHQICAEPTRLFKTEHCQTLWNQTAQQQRRPGPEPGLVCVWKHGNSSLGHAGIITEILPSGQFKTVEGNTGPGKGNEIVREGDGVYERVRDRAGSGSMNILGFISPW